MGIGKNLSKGSEVQRETITNSKSRKNRRQRSRKMMMSLSPGEKLFDTCYQVFANGGPGIVPPPSQIENLRSVLDAITPEDVGLKPDMPYFTVNSVQGTPTITYLHIYECEKFSMGIFCLPASGVIPLHNHPGMTVFSKLLFGTMHIKSYDWVVDKPPHMPTIFKPSAQTPEMRLAKVKIDADFTAPCNPAILYPADGGNMHCFTAVTACAVLDVLGPPYNDPQGRHCTYYLDFPFSNFSVDGLSIPEDESNNYEWLQEKDKPDNVKVVGQMYSGPMIVES
ncbi:plant cysteine oxidase 2 [Arachis stenosperma]|uniref:plant cysteine oxidase 2 n=1 Tax=Arachis stenosperma TaxID=217475 RepID=UPI0025AD12C4|nr:plant cysteine oxidase 2 [Arachis stenosperma]